MKPYSKDLTGKKFGKLTAVKYVGKLHITHSLREFKCDCGKTVVYRGSDVAQGHTTTCGCSRVGCQNARRHGMSNSKEQDLYYNMIGRCHNPEHKNYPNYGAKGVSVCERWRNSIDDFFLDVGKAPSPKHSIDRGPNKYGNYEPGNFRWATMKEQQNNRTNNHIIEYNGLKMTMMQWSEYLGIPYKTISTRIGSGYSVELSLSKNKLPKWGRRSLN
jgi:hypothetical protein